MPLDEPIFRIVMIINANTKIASILKQNAAALNAIIGISQKFEKLRNPLLRKVMADRTSLAMASKLGGCSVEDFYRTLEPLGFKIDRQTKLIDDEKEMTPGFVTLLKKEQLTELDVRAVIASGNDTLQMILEQTKQIRAGQVLKIINTFEPTPLILILKKKGFETYTDKINDEHFETYFHKTAESNSTEVKKAPPVANDWDGMILKFSDRIQKIDVRHLEMPQPMLAILKALDDLPNATALYVYHKRIPVFLLPELAQKGFDYRIKEIMDGEVHLLIFRN